MKNNRMKTSVAAFLCITLLAVAVLMTGCQSKPTSQNSGPTVVSNEDGTETVLMGTGGTTFTLTVVDVGGVETVYRVSTDKKTVGEALESVGLIEGEEGPYGMYIKAVAGMPLDYNTDGKYWAFYENGEYAAKGVDQTAIDTAVQYSLQAAK